MSTEIAPCDMHGLSLGQLDYRALALVSCPRREASPTSSLTPHPFYHSLDPYRLGFSRITAKQPLSNIAVFHNGSLPPSPRRNLCSCPHLL